TLHVEDPGADTLPYRTHVGTTLSTALDSHFAWVSTRALEEQKFNLLGVTAQVECDAWAEFLQCLVPLRLINLDPIDNDLLSAASRGKRHTEGNNPTVQTHGPLVASTPYGGKKR